MNAAKRPEGSEKVWIKRWVLVALIPLIMLFIGGYASNRYEDGRQDKTIENHTKQIEELKESKADKQVQDLILESLGRIEEKVDDLAKEK